LLIKNKILYFLLIQLFLAHLCNSHEIPGKIFKHKIGLGTGGWTNEKFKHIDGAFGFIKKNESEIRLELSYSKFEYYQNLMFCTAYDWSIIKKKSRIDLFLSGELIFNYEWRHFSDFENLHWHTGPFIGFGITPTYNFSSNVSLSLQTDIGAGYQWTDSFWPKYLPGDSNGDWYYFGKWTFKINYKF